MGEFLVNLELTTAMVVLIILMGIITVSRVLKLAVNKYVDKLDEHSDKTPYKFLRNTIDFLGLLIALIGITYTIPALRSVAVTLFASAGIFAAFIAFASQKAFSNIISGIFIVIFKPFRVGDTIHIKGNIGVVEDITLRHTVLKGLENRRRVIPNSTISTDTILNSSIQDERVCKFVEFTIDFDTDVDKAMRIMRREAEAHPDCIDTRTEDDFLAGKRKVDIKVVKVWEYGLRLRAYAWFIDPPTSFAGGCDLNLSIKKAFDAAGIRLPYVPHAVFFQPEQKPAISEKSNEND